MLRVTYDHECDDNITIKRNGIEILRIEEFADPSHPGDHLFFIPLNNSHISESAKGFDWSHELLRDHK